jgi:hypothetical protein
VPSAFRPLANDKARGAVGALRSRAVLDDPADVYVFATISYIAHPAEFTRFALANKRWPCAAMYMARASSWVGLGELHGLYLVHATCVFGRPDQLVLADRAIVLEFQVDLLWQERAIVKRVLL